MLSDGDLIQAVGRTEIYVIENGKRRLIPDVETFYDWDFAPGAVRAMREADLNAISLGDPLPHSERFEFDSPNDHLGSNHWLQTKGTMSTRTGEIKARTHIWTGTEFGGFHGSVKLLFSDTRGMPTGSTQNEHRFAVDGKSTPFGSGPDHVIDWNENIDLSIVQRTKTVQILHYWSPNSIEYNIRRAINIMLPIAEVIKEIKKLLGGAGGGVVDVDTQHTIQSKKDPLVVEPPCMAGQPESGSSGPSPSTGKGIIRGTVISNFEGEAIEGATVEILGTSISAKTDSTGSYVLSNVSIGEQQVKASSGRLQKTQTANVIAENSITVDFKFGSRRPKVCTYAAKPNIDM